MSGGAAGSPHPSQTRPGPTTAPGTTPTALIRPPPLPRTTTVYGTCPSRPALDTMSTFHVVHPVPPFPAPFHWRPSRPTHRPPPPPPCRPHAHHLPAHGQRPARISLRNIYLPYLHPTHTAPLQVLQAFLPPPHHSRSRSGQHCQRQWQRTADARVGLPFASMQATSAAVTLRGAEVLCREIRAPTLTNESESVLGAVHLVTTYFVQAPNWSDLEIFVEIEIFYRI